MPWPWKKKPPEAKLPGGIAGTIGYQFLENLFSLPPEEQDKAHALGVVGMDESTLLEVFRFYVGEHSSTLARSTNLDTKAHSLWVVLGALLGFLGTMFFSAGRMVFQSISNRTVQIEAGLVLCLLVALVFCLQNVTGIRSYYVIFDGYLLNVKPKSSQAIGPEFNVKAILGDTAQLREFLDPSFDRMTYLRQNLLNLVLVTAKNRNANWEKARPLKWAQRAFVLLVLLLISFTLTVGYLQWTSEHRALERGSDISLFE